MVPIRTNFILALILCLNLPRGRCWNLDILESLGNIIQEQVDEQLKPIRVLESIARVRGGIDGTTVSRFSPSEKTFIIRNNVFYTCNDTISDSDGICSGTLQRLEFAKKQDFCFANIHAIINDWYCIAPLGGVQAGIINGNVYCSSPDNSPTLLISAAEYRRLCADIAHTATYKFFTDRNIKEVGFGLSCSGNHPQVCTFSTTLGNVGNVKIVS